MPLPRSTKSREFSLASLLAALKPSQIVASALFKNFIVGVILLAAALVGVETSKSMANEFAPWLKRLDGLVLIIFSVEIMLKIAAEGRRPWRFFLDGWNIFDFAIVAICFLPLQAHYVAVLRLVRILRVLRLVSALPRLQLLVGALLKSLPSIGYVGLLLSILFYIYAVLGVFLWGENDPARFGSLPIAILTLFQCVTMEGWADIMYTQMWGCRHFVQGAIDTACTASRGLPVIAPIYFISFIIMGTMIILNLFIGVMMNSLQEMHDERIRNKADAEKKQENPSLDELADLIEQTEKISKRLITMRNKLTP